MTIHEWLEKNAEKREWQCFDMPAQIWVTKDRGDYLTHVGMEDKLQFLSDYQLEKVQSAWEAGRSKRASETA